MKKALGNVFAPVRFLTPFPPQTSRPCGTPHVYLLLHQVVLSYPQAYPIDHTVLKQSSGPTVSDSLQIWLRKAKSSDVAQSIPQCSLLFDILFLCHQGF